MPRPRSRRSFHQLCLEALLVIAEKGSCTVGDIARKVRTSGSVAKDIVETLVRYGLCQYVACDGAGTVRVVLTRKGAALASAASGQLNVMFAAKVLAAISLALLVTSLAFIASLQSSPILLIPLSTLSIAAALSVIAYVLFTNVASALTALLDLLSMGGDEGEQSSRTQHLREG